MSWLLSKFFGSNKRPSEDEGTDANITKKARTAALVNPYEGQLSTAFSASEFDVSSVLSSDGGLTIAPSSFCSVVSTSPAYISIGLAKDALPEDMGIVENKEFTVNTVSEWMADAATKTVGAYNLPDSEADLKTGITTTASEQVKVPRVAEAAVTLECRLRQKYTIKDSEGGVTSTVVIAEVLAVVVNHGVLASAADGTQVVDAELLQPVAALGNGVLGATTVLHTAAHAHAEASTPVDPVPPHPLSPTTPVNPEAARSEGGREVAAVVAEAVAEALENQADPPAVQEVSVVLGSANGPDAREGTPVSVLVQQVA